LIWFSSLPIWRAYGAGGGVIAFRVVFAFVRSANPVVFRAHEPNSAFGKRIGRASRRPVGERQTEVRGAENRQGRSGRIGEAELKGAAGQCGWIRQDDGRRQGGVKFRRARGKVVVGGQAAGGKRLAIGPPCNLRPVISEPHQTIKTMWVTSPVRIEKNKRFGREDVGLERCPVQEIRTHLHDHHFVARASDGEAKFIC